MTNAQHTPLEELDLIDAALAIGEATLQQEKRGQQLVMLLNAAPELLLSLRAVLGAMQKRAPYEDAVIIITMAERAISKAEGKSA